MTDNMQDPTSLDNNEASVDTQAVNSAAPVDVNRHADTSDTSTSAPNNAGLPDEATVQAALREYGKLKQVQKELEEAKAYKERYSNIETKAMRSPESYKRALMEYNDMSDGEAELEVQRLKSQGRWQTVTSTPTIPKQNYSSEDLYKVAAQIAEDTYNKKRIAESTQREFFEKVPQMDPKNLTEEQKQSVGTLAVAIEYEARRRIANNPSANIVEAMVNVYKEYTGKTDDQLAEAREAGRQQGYLEANSIAAQASKPARGYSNKESSFGLTPQQLAEAKEEGLTPEQYAKYSKPIAQIE